MSYRPTADAPPLALTNPNGPDCCGATWSQDGQHLYIGNHVPSLHGPDFIGLWRAEAALGEFKPLVRGYAGDVSQPLSPDQSLNSVNYAFEANGELFAFASIRPASEEAMYSPDVLSLAKIAPDGQINLLRTDSYLIGEALGATDGSGAAIVDIQDW